MRIRPGDPCGLPARADYRKLSARIGRSRTGERRRRQRLAEIPYLALETELPAINSLEFKRLIDKKTRICCKIVARLSQDEVVENLRPYQEVIERNRFSVQNGITELRILLASLMAMAVLEDRYGRAIW
jgi:hypothetical protein